MQSPKVQEPSSVRHIEFLLSLTVSCSHSANSESLVTGNGIDEEQRQLNRRTPSGHRLQSEFLDRT